MENRNIQRNLNQNELRKAWEREQEIAYIHGWDFSHIDGRSGQGDLPWDYDAIVRQYLKKDMKILDYDTGGGEYLLSLHHPYGNTAATEGYPPNVKLCRDTLVPLGIDLRECSDPSNIPFPDELFDMIINRHGGFDPAEIRRLLKDNGLFVTQQVGGSNDQDLVRMLMPEAVAPSSNLYLKEQTKAFEDASFEIIRAEEAFRPIWFTDIGALVWFARIIEWEFTGFSVDRCFERLLELQSVIEQKGRVEGTIHRYLIVARKLSSKGSEM